MTKSLLLIPRMSEKAYDLSQRRNTYVFDVPRTSNAQDVAIAVNEQFKVVVVGVNLTNIKGKTKRSFVKASRTSKFGRESTTKKAYVRLKDGDSLPFFAAVAEEEAKEKAAEAKKADATKQPAASKKPRLLGRRSKKEEK